MDLALVRIRIQGNDVLLKQGEWSAFLPVKFELVPYLAEVTAICRFFVKQACHRFPPLNDVPDGYVRCGGDEFRPVALLGLNAGQNLFVDAAGKWQASYVPAIIRRYPFALTPRGTDGQYIVCLDEGSDLRAWHAWVWWAVCGPHGEGRCGRPEPPFADRGRGVGDAPELPGPVALEALDPTLGRGDDHRLLLARLAGERVQVRALGAGHGFVARDPLFHRLLGRVDRVDRVGRVGNRRGIEPRSFIADHKLG